MKIILDWLVSIGGSPVDVLLMGVIIGGFVMQWNQKRLRNAEIKELFHKYTQLNNLVGKYGVAMQCKLGIQLVAEHYSGDYSMAEPLLDNLDRIPGSVPQPAPQKKCLQCLNFFVVGATNVICDNCIRLNTKGHFPGGIPPVSCDAQKKPEE